MPRYLLDTNILIYIRQHKPPQIKARFARESADSVAMSVVTWGELLYGVQHSAAPERAREKLAALETYIPVLPVPLDAAEHYGEIRTDLAARGLMIGANDLWIAAHARAAGLVLVSNNTREFERVPRLMVENWATAG